MATASHSPRGCSALERGLHDASVNAGAAYEVFADAVEIPRWLPIVQTARVLARTTDGRPGGWPSRAGSSAAPSATRSSNVRRGGAVGLVVDAGDVERGARRRGALHPAVGARVPDDVPARTRAADRGRSHRERARQAPRVARRRRVSRTPTPALLTHTLSKSTRAYPKRVSVAAIDAVAIATVSSSGSKDVKTAKPQAAPPPRAASEPGHSPSGTGSAALFDKGESPDRASRARGEARSLPRGLDDALPADRRTRRRARASPTRRCCGRRTSRCRTRARSSMPPSASSGSRRSAARCARTREGDRRRAAGARRRVHQPPPARPVRQAAHLAVRAALEGRAPRRPRDHRADLARGRDRSALPRRASCASSASASRSTTSAAATRAWARSRRSTPTS